MDNYLAILPLAPPLDVNEVRLLWRLACLELYRVNWLRSYLSVDGTRMLCWYEAPDADSVRFVLRQQGSPAGQVWRAGVAVKNNREPSSEGASYVAVEMGGDATAGPHDSASMKVEVSDTLAAGGFTVIQEFSAPPGKPSIHLLQEADADAVRGYLRAADFSAITVWACTELNPRPQALFRSPTPAKIAGDGDAIRAAVKGESSHSGLLQSERSTQRTPHQYDAIVIGAGISGIATLERLLRMNLRVLVLESGSDVGGVWHWNRYPGARVDSETFTYGFDFDDAVIREWRWSELFAAQPEISRYLQHVVARLDLRPYIRTGTRVAAARYIESVAGWEVVTEGGETITTHYLIAATGTLTAPQLPDYPGIQDFTGESHHTARWPSTGVELSGKRVGVIGTGATGVQVIQTIAPLVEHLTVFQRTPTYCLPQRNRRLCAAEQDRIRRDLPLILAACRGTYSGFMHMFDPRPGITLSPDEREAKFEALWRQPGFAFWFANFGDLMMNDEVNAHACEFIRGKIRAQLHNPEMARRLTPDHPFGAKRVPLENGYYEAFNRANVRLVDLRETPIRRITRDGITTADDEERLLDVIIYATGFDAGTGALTRIDIRGPSGLTLAEKWRPGAQSYLGLLVHGFPNLFIVNGPQNAAALCNGTRCIEQNVDWIARCIGQLRERGIARIEATAAAEDEWTAHVEEVARASVLRNMTDSWYFGANTPGKARKATVYAAGALAYRKHCEAAAREGYPGLVMSGPGCG